MNNTRESSVYVLRYLLIVFISLLILYFGRTLFIPMSYGLFIAIVMYPVCKKLERYRWPRSLAVAACLSVVIVLFLALIALLLIQFKAFQDDLPRMKQQLLPSLSELQLWIQTHLGIDIGRQDEWMRKEIGEIGNVASWLPGTMAAAVSSFFTLFMTPVFAALFLYNRSTFVNFLLLLAGERYKASLQFSLSQAIHTYFSYIKGMIMVYAIVGVLNSIGLLVIGVEHAILFGFLTAIMTIIPYVGLIVSSLLPISLVWMQTGSVWPPLAVIAVFAFVQYLEANVIFPKVVGAQLNVNTWSMLVFILVGAVIWGVSGMVLFIPFAGILKIVTDHTEEWKPLNVLLRR